MKEEQNHEKDSEQLNFLNGSTKEATNQKDKYRDLQMLNLGIKRLRKNLIEKLKPI